MGSRKFEMDVKVRRLSGNAPGGNVARYGISSVITLVWVLFTLSVIKEDSAIAKQLNSSTLEREETTQQNLQLPSTRNDPWISLGTRNIR